VLHYLDGRPKYLIDLETGCWNWIAATAKNTGYGVACRPGVNRIEAHRAHWEMKRGPIPSGMQIDHLCRNRKCVNLDHLEIVSPKDNVRRGRYYKLSQGKAAAIRALWATGYITQSQLALAFEVDDSVISRTIRGEAWPEQVA